MNNITDELQSILDQIQHLSTLDFEGIESYYSKRLEISKQLGKAGWVISAKRTPNNQNEWLQKIESNGEEAILAYFSECDIDEMIFNIEEHYQQRPERYYISCATENYYTGHYTESAVFFLAVLDYRICRISPERIRKKRSQIEEIMKEVRCEIFSKTEGRLGTRLFFTLDFIPSFVEFARRLFIEGDYQFEAGIEPPYLNRNWLMHGRMTRRVKRYECVQLINAINTLIDIEKELASDGQNEV